MVIEEVEEFRGDDAAVGQTQQEQHHDFDDADGAAQTA